MWSYDVRPAVKEEVLSLGARFLEIDLVKTEDKQSGGYAKEMDEEFYRRQREAMMKVIQESDVVITTAAIPGRKAPVLVTEEMVEAMPPGSLIIDLAAETGGNCALTKAREVITVHGVTIDGTINIPTTVPYHSSQMYGKNLTTFLLHLVKEGTLDGADGDEIVQDTMVTRGGEVVNARVREALGLAPIAEEPTEADPDKSVANDDAAAGESAAPQTADAVTAEQSESPESTDDNNNKDV